MSEHTKEPWRVEIDNSDDAVWANKFPIIVSDEEHIIGIEGFYGKLERDKANARRVVACVNACAGISTDDLEEVQDNFGGAYLEARNKAVDFKTQRDDLLAASKSLADLWGTKKWTERDTRIAVENLRGVIERVK